ncbi:MAG TPA: family 78 glycoside hydrolase catalytic domain [Bacilli bacterium]
MSRLIVKTATCEYKTNPIGTDSLKPRGPGLQSRTRYYYRIRVWDQQGRTSEWSETAYWETAFLGTDEWVADWITADMSADKTKSEPAYLLRKSFSIQGTVAKARIYATSLGVYELHLNGGRVGDALLTPGWTSYNKRLQYQTYDVTSLLQDGGNAVGVILGSGWYKATLGWKGEKSLFGDIKAALLQLHITYEDGSEVVIASDSSWKAETGAILISEIYYGESYDARLEKAGWNCADYGDEAWRVVTLLDHTKETLVAQENLPTRVIQTIKPVSVFTTPAGDTVLDMGQNMVGWIHFQVKGSPGHKITLQHAEVLDKDGNIYLGNLRSAKQTIEYICKGGSQESYEPHFTFQGFRYVKVEGYPGELSLDNFRGRVIHTDMEPTGSFECSDPLINQLQSNIVWGQKGNFLDIPTDCPQRDERLGWTGDAQVFIRTAAFNMNVASFFTKWLKDLKADQLPDGGVPFVIPNILEGDHSSSAWGDAAVICPWTVYLCYGDVRVLEEQYESMKAWVEYIRKQGDNEFLWNSGFHFGDWLGLDAKENSYIGATPKDLIATAFYAYSTRLFAQTAEVLQRAEDAREYRRLYEQIVQNFRCEFVTPNGRLAADTQTAYALALMFDLVEGEVKKRVAKSLAGHIEENKFHLTTGFVGTPYLCLVLSENGYHDVATKLVHQQEYPSWLYSVNKGATTVWEHWDGIKEDGSFWSDDMNSFNHYAYGAIGDWFYRVVAGIDMDEKQPGYKHILIRPQLMEGLSYARASLKSMYGEIASGWEVSGASDGIDNGSGKRDSATEESSKHIKVKVTIPVNTTATVELPSASLEAVSEGASGEKISQIVGVVDSKQAEGMVILELTSGSYEFSYLM